MQVVNKCYPTGLSQLNRSLEPIGTIGAYMITVGVMIDTHVLTFNIHFQV